jgi:hypothetical protein
MAENIKITGDKKLIKDLKNLAKKWPEIYKEETTKILKLIAARYESEVVQRTPAGVGGASGLRGSIGATEPKVSAAGASVSVGSPLEYAEPVEFGRKAGRRPPVGPLELWAIRKLGISKDEARSVGFALSIHIGRHGTEGAFMFRDGWAAMEGWADEQAAILPKRITDRAMAQVD